MTAADNQRTARWRLRYSESPSARKMYATTTRRVEQMAASIPSLNGRDVVYEERIAPLRRSVAEFAIAGDKVTVPWVPAKILDWAQDVRDNGGVIPDDGGSTAVR